MHLLTGLLLGTLLTSIAFYWYYHKHNIVYNLTMLKEDIANLQVKLDKYFTTVK